MRPVRVDQLIGSATHFRFPTGAFGKTCMLVTVFDTSCAAIAWSAREPWVSAAALGIAAVVTLAALWRLFNFADKNPSAAILEGAEFIRHEQLKLAAKGLPSLPGGGAIQVDEPERIPLLTDESATSAPDVQKPSEGEGGAAQ